MKEKKAKSLVDLENIFLHLLVIGERRQLQLEPVFAYELCSVPSSLIDEHGCLRKPNKAGLVKRLGVPESSPTAEAIVIVDVSQLFYHIVCPHGGVPSDLILAMQDRMSQ